MLLLLFTILGNAIAQSINPPEGSIWDFIESNSVSQGLKQQEIVERPTVGITQEVKPLPAFFSGQMISTEERSFYKDPFTTLEHDPLFIDMINQDDFDIPIVINDAVKKWMNYLLGPGKKHYAKWLARSTKYTPAMRKSLKEAGLPEDLIYLSMIESGFNTSAYSSAAAVGLWQFIPSTGKEMGLRIDWWIDERRDPEKSTAAAIEFLSRLHKRFGHWYLAWAGYNGGPGRVSRAIKKYESNDFWDLSQRGAFPSETDNYVPKIIAAAILGKYAERYGFTNIKYQTAPKYQYVTVDANTGVDVMAKCANMKESQFLAMNPEILRWSLPPTPDKQKVKVPEAKEFLVALSKIPPAQRVTYRRHVVKKGESLGTISKKYNVSVGSIQKVNKIRNPNLISVGDVLMIPSPGTPGDKSYVSTKPKSSSKSSKSSSKSSKSSKSKTKVVYHQVKKGESLGLIAQKYGVSTSDVKRWNKISNANRIYAGQKLKIYTGKVTWTTYTVKSGDTLGYIAKKYNCSVNDIKEWNGLSSSRIYVGQKLKIQK